MKFFTLFLAGFLGTQLAHANDIHGHPQSYDDRLVITWKNNTDRLALVTFNVSYEYRCLDEYSSWYAKRHTDQSAYVNRLGENNTVIYYPSCGSRTIARNIQVEFISAVDADPKPSPQYQPTPSTPSSSAGTRATSPQPSQGGAVDRSATSGPTQQHYNGVPTSAPQASAPRSICDGGGLGSWARPYQRTSKSTSWATVEGGRLTFHSQTGTYHTTDSILLRQIDTDTITSMPSDGQYMVNLDAKNGDALVEHINGKGSSTQNQYQAYGMYLYLSTSEDARAAVAEIGMLARRCR